MDATRANTDHTAACCSVILGYDVLDEMATSATSSGPAQRRCIPTTEFRRLFSRLTHDCRLVSGERRRSTIAHTTIILPQTLELNSAGDGAVSRDLLRDVTHLGCHNANRHGR